MSVPPSLAVLTTAMGTWTRVLLGTADPDGALRQRWTALPGNIRGILWIVVAGVAMTVMAAMIKSTGARIPVVQILFIRQVVMTVLLAPRMIRDPRGAFATDHLRLHAMRVGFACVAMTTGFTALVHMPLADAVAISFTRSFFITIFAIALLNEVVSRHRWTAVGCGFLGVVIMLRPDTGGIDIYALMGLVSAAAVGMIMVIVRKLAQREPLGTVMSYQAVGVGAALLIPAMLYWVPPTPYEWAMLVVIGLLSAGGQTLNFNGYRVGEATAVTSADYLRLVYATILGVLVFGEWPTWAAMAGATLIIGTTLYAMWAERKPAPVAMPPAARGAAPTPAE
jgi:drug/metabolite transporter (DMT)-like permease